MLYKTIELPEDSCQAINVFNSIIQEQSYVLLVIFGSSPQIKTIVQQADQAAGGSHPSWRRVVWAKNPLPILPLIDSLPAVNGINKDFCQNAVGISIAFDSTVCDCFRVEDATSHRIVIAFISAGSH